jgi:DNA-binding transcriptional MocR family regulator
MADDAPRVRTGAAIAPVTLSELLGEGWRRPGGSASALADALRAQVVDGRLAARTRLPSERALAPALRVSRGTVSRAYDQLRADGFLASARGAGSWLTLPGGAPAPFPSEPAPAAVTDLAVAALPAPEPLLSEAAAAAARALGRHAADPGYLALGLPALREAVAARFAERGLPTSADQILVTAGAQHALHLLLILLCAPGDRALVDAPAYPRTLSALRGARVRPVAVPLGADGWDVASWQRTLAAAAPAMAITVPEFQNPTGLTLAAEDRAALAEACARAGTLLVADETHADLRLDGPALPPPVAAFDPGGAVATIGTMSKSAWGGLRIGWIRATPRLVRELAAVRASVDMASPLLEQLLALELLGRWDEVLAARHALLRPRRDALLDGLAAHAPAWEVRRPHGGLTTWVRLPSPTATALAAAASRAGVRITPGPSFSVDGTFEHHVRLPFALAPEALQAAVRTLAGVAARLGDRAADELPAGAV